MINIDDIVFNQTQLDDAIGRGCKNICLCDNSFTLPCTDGVSYMAIGDVKVVIRLDKGRRYNISFDGFEPTVLYTGGYTGITEQKYILQLCGSYGSYGSSGSYGSGSGGSFVGSGMYSLYGWGSSLYATSATGSYAASYTASYTTSYRTSYVTSYTTSGSALIALREPYHTETAENGRQVFYAAGYGLNLI